MQDEGAKLRALPKIDTLIQALGPNVAHQLAAKAARGAVEEARVAILNGAEAPSLEGLTARAKLLLEMADRTRLGRVINATGVLLHTNLGRAPLSASAIEAMGRIVGGYSNLEYDLESGRRGSRYHHATGLLQTLTGAPASLVVNNNAAAVTLALRAIARDREVLISRGELIEIGGGFRIPEILGESGATLKEVGTTNRTHPADYERAIGEDTAALMKIHPSNYAITGFVSSVAASDVVSIAHARGLEMIYDIGSGLLRRRIGGISVEWLRDEPTVEEALAEGADLVTFSGDKLLGGPQAGIILGSEEAVGKLRASPMLRAVRVDKTTLAALEATLLTYLSGTEAELPLWTMALASPAEIEARAVTLQDLLGDAPAKLEITDGFSTAGGGAAPGSKIPTVLVEISPLASSPEAVVRGLLDHDPPVVARVENDRVVVDLRTVSAEEDTTVARALTTALT